LELFQYRYSRDVHFINHLLQKGKGYHFLEFLGVCRLHNGGVFSSKSNREKAVLRYRINKDSYYKNGDNHSRILCFLAITWILKSHAELLPDKDSEFSIRQLFIKLILLVRTTVEFKTYINILLILLNTKKINIT